MYYHEWALDRNLNAVIFVNLFYLSVKSGDTGKHRTCFWSKVRESRHPTSTSQAFSRARVAISTYFLSLDVFWSWTILTKPSFTFHIELRIFSSTVKKHTSQNLSTVQRALHPQPDLPDIKRENKMYSRLKVCDKILHCHIQISNSLEINLSQKVTPHVSHGWNEFEVRWSGIRERMLSSWARFNVQLETGALAACSSKSMWD